MPILHLVFRVFERNSRPPDPASGTVGPSPDFAVFFCDVVSSMEGATDVDSGSGRTARPADLRRLREPPRRRASLPARRGGTGRDGLAEHPAPAGRRGDLLPPAAARRSPPARPGHGLAARRGPGRPQRAAARRDLRLRRPRGDRRAGEPAGGAGPLRRGPFAGHRADRPLAQAGALRAVRRAALLDRGSRGADDRGVPARAGGLPRAERHRARRGVPSRALPVLEPGDRVRTARAPPGSRRQARRNQPLAGFSPAATHAPQV